MNMKKRHKLRLVGITYNQIESGVYALILEEINGNRRIPIVIGFPEAQAIECKLQEIKTPRPLTHDLMKSIMNVFDIRLSCVDIKRLPNGVFAADLVMESQDGELHKIDARSSDAIALAIRTGAPIYTTEDVLEEAGIRRPSIPSPLEDTPSTLKVESFDSIEEIIDAEGENPDDLDAEIFEFLSNFSDKEIEAQIAKFASDEKYEIAARLKNLLNRRRNK